MDCNHARLLLHFVRPGSTELEAMDLESLRHHLVDCTDCGTTARAEQRFDEAVGRAMRAVPVPPDLRQRLAARLVREDPQRGRRRLLGGLAAAAALLLAAGLTWQLWPHRLEVEMPFVSAPSRPADVEAWFEDQGIPMEVPRALNFDLLYSYGVSVHQGQRVARLVYRSEGARSAIAEVLVLPESLFLMDRPKTVSVGRIHVEALDPKDQPGFLFLIIHDGSLGNLFKHRGVVSLSGKKDVEPAGKFV